ncbi:hypothetical protein [Microcoleus sp. herbarium12]
MKRNFCYFYYFFEFSFKLAIARLAQRQAADRFCLFPSSFFLLV